MNTTIHETLSELKEFVAVQAAEDAVMPPSERRHQGEVVTDVIGQESLKPNVRKDLLNDYFGQVAALAKS